MVEITGKVRQMEWWKSQEKSDRWNGGNNRKSQTDGMVEITGKVRQMEWCK
jgi:hypothetical protein